ncbi:PAS domain S-box protein [Salinirubellus sp. GCM10025818]|uniref:PAS domain S-box protein n=1 Tax=Salinirubellus TaxID=2162630 RepID=UPI0030CC40AA
MNTRARSPAIRVLHVTDEQDSVEVVTGAFERADDRIEVVTARSVDEGLGRLAGDPIDCVVSDYDLPGRNGLEFLEAVRETHGDLPFVLYTDDGSEGVASEAVSAGVTEYLPKRSVTENPGRLAGRCLDAARGYRDRRQAVERRCLLGVVRDVGRVLLRADTCEELDQGVCDVIADADPYCFVWIGDREPGSRRITPRARPTGGGGLADELSAAMEDEADWNPAVEALDAREIRVVHDAEDSPCGPWRELALERGFRSSAAVPLVHESEDHGVLNVYAARPGAFDGSGRSILIDLGADIAHARHALRIRGDLKRTAGRLEALFENSPNMIDIHDADGTIVEANPRMCEKLGYSEDELRGMRVWEIDRTIDPENAAALWDTIESGERHELEGSYRCRDGLTFPAEVHLQRLGEGKDGPFVVISRDITERKRHERELERKNERLEEFVRVVSHDLRNPLNVAEGMLDLAREDFDNDRLDDVERAHRRMRVLIDDLLRYAQEGETAMDVQPIALAGMVEGCWENVETSGATLVVDTERTVHADASRLRQLLENLIRNAVDHGGTNVTVTVGDLDDGFYVADDGPGIPPEKRDAVFEVGYSTNREGTGFGLAIAREVADAQGWEIDVTASEAGGARFDLTGVDTS